MGDKLLEQVFNLKFMAKQLNRSAVKCEKDEKAERLKVKKAIEKGNLDGAKIYAEVGAVGWGLVVWGMSALGLTIIQIGCVASGRGVKP